MISLLKKAKHSYFGIFDLNIPGTFLFEHTSDSLYLELARDQIIFLRDRKYDKESKFV